jgi:threonine aldolase
MVDRLAEDHTNARRLAEGLAQLPGVLLDPARIQTNIVIFELAPDAPSAAGVAVGMAAHGVKVGVVGPRRIRVVTHYGVGSDDIDQALTVAKAVLEASPA